MVHPASCLLNIVSPSTCLSLVLLTSWTVPPRCHNTRWPSGLERNYTLALWVLSKTTVFHCLSAAQNFTLLYDITFNFRAIVENVWEAKSKIQKCNWPFATGSSSLFRHNEKHVSRDMTSPFWFVTQILWCMKLAKIVLSHWPEKRWPWLWDVWINWLCRQLAYTHKTAHINRILLLKNIIVGIAEQKY